MRLIFALLFWSSLSFADTSTWVTSWAASPQPAQKYNAVTNQTVRQTVHLSLGGTSLRLRISNVYGHTPLRIDSAFVAVQLNRATVVDGTSRRLLFSKKNEIIIPAGEEAVSDAVDFDSTPSTNISVSLFLPVATAIATFHSRAKEDAYVSTDAGDFTSSPSLERFQTAPSWLWISGVEVLSPLSNAQTLVAIGDSITDGVSSSFATNHRWPDFFARRLLVAGKDVAVANQGISRNFVLRDVMHVDEPSVSLLARFDRDVLSQTGVKTLIILEGINDIGNMPVGQPALELANHLVTAYYRLAQKARARGIRVYIATLPPVGGSGYFSPVKEDCRRLVNNWIKKKIGIDGVIDFDRAIRDPLRPDRMLQIYDSGDHLHPSDAGYEAMANAIDINIF